MGSFNEEGPENTATPSQGMTTFPFSEDVVMACKELGFKEFLILQKIEEVKEKMVKHDAQELLQLVLRELGRTHKNPSLQN